MPRNRYIHVPGDGNFTWVEGEWEAAAAKALVDKDEDNFGLLVSPYDEMKTRHNGRMWSIGLVVSRRRRSR